MTEGSNLLLFGGLTGIIVSCWNYIKQFAWRIVNLFIIKHQLESNTHGYLVNYLVENNFKRHSPDQFFGTSQVSLKSGITILSAYEQIGMNNVVFWINKKPLFLRSNKVKDQPVNESVMFLRGSIDFDVLLAKAIDHRNSIDLGEENKERRFNIHRIPAIEEGNLCKENGYTWYKMGRYRLLNVKKDDIGFKEKNSALNDLIYPDNVLHQFNEIKIWKEHKEWYFERGIPWKRGWLLYGPGGTGKTALVRAMAEDLDLPIFSFHLPFLNNNQFIKAWNELKRHAPCIALIEDFDNVFHGRENIANRYNSNPFMFSYFDYDDEDKGNNKDSDKLVAQTEEKKKKKNDFGSPLTFDTILNCLDGIERVEGVFTIITTNDPSKIDEALGRPVRRDDGTTESFSTRPGRIDRALELTYMLPEHKIQLTRRILKEYPSACRDVCEFFDANPNIKHTPAQVSDLCGQIAQACLYREKLGCEPWPIPDRDFGITMEKPIKRLNRHHEKSLATI